MPKISKLTSIYSKTTTNVAKVTPGSCSASTWSRNDVWNEFIKPRITPLYNPNQRRKITMTQAGTAGLGDIYYGEFTDFVPEPLKGFKFESEFKPKRKFKEYKAAQATGQILLSPMRSLTGGLTIGQGFWAGEGVKGVDLIIEHKMGNSDFPFQATGCPNHPNGRLFGDFYVPGTDASTQCVTRFKYATYTAPLIRDAMSVDSAQQLVNELLSHLDNMEPSPDLVVEARAEAASAVLDVSTTLAEAPELISTILRCIELILAKYLEMRGKIKVLKKDRISSDGLMSEISALWLQYRYAIMPNVYTIEDTLEYLGSITTSYQSVRTGKSNAFEYPEFDGWTPTPPESIERCFIKNRFDMKMGTARRFLGANLASTAWELVPWSFVIDWVFSIGDYITSLSSPTGSVQEAAMSSLKVKPSVITYSHPDWVGGPVEVNLEYYRASMIDPTDYLRITAQFDMNWKRWLDAISLSWQVKKGSFKQLLRKLT